VVTLPDIGDRAASDVALQIGRQWGVGAKGAAGDPKKNLGVVVLLVPMKNHRPGTGQVFIATGRGAEGFLTDARAGRIRDAMVPFLAREEYGKGLALGVDLIAQAIATEFGVTLANPEYVVAPPASVRDGRPQVTIPFGWAVALFILLLILTRGRILWLPFMLMGRGGREGRGGWGGGGFGGGGGGGGFGGFGGGGGFSGGGAGGRF
jgi:uncharacterized protein